MADTTLNLTPGVAGRKAIEFVDVTYSRESGGMHTARLIVKVDGARKDSQGRSKIGVLHAIAQAMKNIVPNTAVIDLYEASNPEPEKNSESVADAIIVLTEKNVSAAGSGSNTDTATASAEAYVNALNAIRTNAASGPTVPVNIDATFKGRLFSAVGVGVNARVAIIQASRDVWRKIFEVGPG